MINSIKSIFYILTLTIFVAGCSSTDQITSPPPSLVKLDIEPKISVLDVGTSEYFKAVGTYSDGTVSDVSDEVTWSLENDSGIIVSKNDPDYPGLTFAEAVLAGSDNLVASLNSISTTASVTVVDVSLVSIAISPTDVSLPVRSEATFTAEGTYSDGHVQDLTEESVWSAFNASTANVISITGQGIVSGVNEGTVQLKATFGLVDSNAANITVHDPNEIVLIEVSPVFSQLFIEGSQQFSARAHYSDGSIDFITDSALWLSSDTSVASQDLFRKGLFHARSVGSSFITASLGGVKYEGTALLTVEAKVLESIVISPRDGTVLVGDTRKYFTEAKVSDGSFVSINTSTNQSYSVGDSSIAYISNLPENKGQLTGLKAGTTSVISTFIYDGATYTDQTTVTVTP